MLVVAPQIGLITLVLIVKDRMTEGRRFDPAIRRGVAVQDIKANLLSDRASILKRRVYRLIGAAKDLGRAEPGTASALAGDIHHHRGLIAILCLHAAEDDISPLPHAGR